jgi:hypothetical protein
MLHELDIHMPTGVHFCARYSRIASGYEARHEVLFVYPAASSSRSLVSTS